MPHTPAGKPKARRRRNWRHSETRASDKMIAKRVTKDDHAALIEYADDHNTKIAEMLDPFVAELIKKARDYCDAKPADSSESAA